MNIVIRTGLVAACFVMPVSGVEYLDLDADSDRQVVVDRDPNQYLGHPTTCLLEDGQTILCVYPAGHGRGAIIYKRSKDGGLTWSERLSTPQSWATSKETPTLHRVVDAAGKKRVLMFSGLFPARMAVSEDDGMNWSELESVGDWGGIVVMNSVEPVRGKPGHYLAIFHDDGRFFSKQAQSSEAEESDEPITFTLYKTRSTDGGLSWSVPEPIYASHELHLCEGGFVRSPDGNELACLLRENSRRHHSQVMFSRDEGETWTEPQALPFVLDGDRHTAKYGPDGRLFVAFRRRSPKGATARFEGDWVAWVGTYEALRTDAEAGRNGQYVVRLKENHHGSDCGYPGVEALPDGSLVSTTYGHWIENEPPFILTVRLKLAELDALAAQKPKLTAPVAR